MLAFAYPGIPLIYYGEELGMRGGADPANRAGMVWDESRWNQERLSLVRQLCRLRRDEPALREGRYVAMPQPGTGVVAFARETGVPTQGGGAEGPVRGRPVETVLCVLNATEDERALRLFVPLWFFFDAVPLRDLLSGATFTMEQGCVDVKLPPRAALLLQPRDAHAGGYKFFK